MNRSELVQAVADRSGVSASDVDSTLVGLFEVVAGVVAKEPPPGEKAEKVSVTGFMSFERTERKARKGRNPATGEPLHIPAGSRPGRSGRSCGSGLSSASASACGSGRSGCPEAVRERLTPILVTFRRSGAFGHRSFAFRVGCDHG